MPQTGYCRGNGGNGARARWFWRGCGDGGFQVNVFLRTGNSVYRTYNTQGRGTEQLSHTFPLIDLLPYGRQEHWQDSPEGWPQSLTGSGRGPSEAFAQYAH